jgi:dihydroflavonol-4-reductase
MNFLVTGGAGFLGQHLIKILVSRYPESRVTALDIKKNPFPHHDIEQLGALVFYDVDIRRPADIESHIARADVVFHLAGLISFWEKDRDRLFEINVEAVRAVVALSLKYGIKKLIHVGSVAGLGYKNDRHHPVGEDFQFPFESVPYKPYMISKKLGQDLVLQAAKSGKLQAVVVCPAQMWGAGDYFNSTLLIKALKARKIIANIPGGTYVADVEDVARGVVAAFEKGRPGEIYILGGYNYPFAETYALVAEALGVRPPGLTMPRSLHKPLFYLFRALERISKKPPALTSDSIDSGFMFRYFDSAKAGRELGWQVQKPFAQTVREQIAYLKKYDLL